MEKLTVGSLFAGIGGFELGLEQTGGFRTVWQVEIDPYANQVLANHWPDATRWRDVRTFPPPPASPWLGHKWKEKWGVDVICGGFPCQDISFAGKGAGLAGARSGLWYEFARIVGVVRPRYVLVENVAALLVRGLDAVLGTLDSLGYDAEWHCVPASYVGAPHIRDRVFILGHPTVHDAGQSEIGPNNKRKREDTAKVGRRLRAQLEGSSEPCGICENIPDASGGRYGTPESSVLAGRNGIVDEGRWTAKCRLGIHPNEFSTGLDGCGGWECGIPRVIHGQANRVQRLKCLGNAVVPAVAELIGRRLLEIDGRADST